MPKIHNALRHPNGNGFPTEFPISELERVLQESFSSVGMCVRGEYFVKGSNYYPQNLSFFVLSYYNWGNRFKHGKRLVAETIVTNEEVDDFKFKYIDKFAVVPKLQQNGIGEHMIRIATNCIDPDKPTILRTSTNESDNFYSRYSDRDRLVVQTKSGVFFIHCFGFFNKETGKDLFEGAKEKFYQAAYYVAQKPKTTLPLENLRILQSADTLNQKLY